MWGQDDGKVRKLFAEKYPNCIAFCGHEHLTSAEEAAIWQGEFTCVAVPSLSYCITLGGRENGYSLADKPYVEPKYMMPAIGGGSQGAGPDRCSRSEQRIPLLPAGSVPLCLRVMPDEPSGDTCALCASSLKEVGAFWKSSPGFGRGEPAL